MTVQPTFTAHPWPILGAPTPGTVAALAVGLHAAYTIFAGTRVGLYRTHEVDKDAQPHWQKLPAAPLEILALALSPAYAIDTTLLAGTGQGLFLSRDGGDHWQTTQTPMPDPVVLCLAFSPNYAADGIILAGTLEDGLYFSDSRGVRWSSRSVGMLDAAVYALAISPNFARDETVFAGTESALYYSYNGARAWKLLDFPEEAAPILSLALSPHFAQDQTIYAGTEQNGLYRSPDLGKTWQKVDLPAACVNALVIAPEEGGVIAATNSGLYHSNDGEERWTCLLDFPDAFSLAANNNLLIAGIINQGAWLSTDRTTWQPFFTLPARSLTGMVLSPRFDTDRLAFLYGTQEGVWQTVDGGRSWRCLNETLPSLDIRSLALSPHIAEEGVVVAATRDGLLLSEDAGNHWSVLMDAPASLVAFSPGGNLVAVAASEGEIRMAEALKGEWQRLSVPWGRQGEALALAIDDRGWLQIAWLDLGREEVSIWQGKPGQMRQIMTQPASAMPVVRFWVGQPGASGETWYASVDQQVWEFARLSDEAVSDATAVQAKPVFAVADGSRILSLTGSQSASGPILFATTGQFLYQGSTVDDWTVVHDFGDERAVGVALSSTYPEDGMVFALLLGGAFGCWVSDLGAST